MTLPDKKPKIVLMDLDDTITSFDSICKPAWIKCCDQFVLNNPASFSNDELYNSIFDAGKWYWADPDRHKKGRENLKHARRDVVRFALQTLDIENENWVQIIADSYTELQDSMISLLPGAKESLELLRSLNIRIAVITNGASTVQREKLKRFDIERYFEEVFIDTEVGYSKPDARIFQYALDTLNVTSAESWMVGDNLKWDVFGAQQLGIFAVWNNYKKIDLPKDTDIIPDLTVSSIYEMSTIISNMPQ